MRLNKSFYKTNKELKDLEDNIFSKASRNISTITPIIFGLILAPTVVVSSIISQGAFLMVANILLAIGLSFVFLNRVYQGNASFLEIVLTLGIITGFFFLVLNLSPVISSWNFLGVVSFINLFASSINSFFLLRTIVLPPILSPIQFTLGKLGIKIDVHLDKKRDFKVDLDLGNGQKPDPAVFTLLKKNYKFASSEKLNDADWRRVAIKPYNNSKDLIYGYVTKYRASLFGAINNEKKISTYLKYVDNIMYDSATDSTHNCIFATKLNNKSLKVKQMIADLDSLTKLEGQELTSFVAKRFIYTTLPNDFKQKCIDCLNENIQIQMKKIITLLQCYPLHLAMEFINIHVAKDLSDEHISRIKAAIATDESLALYPEDMQASMRSVG